MKFERVVKELAGTFELARVKVLKTLINQSLVWRAAFRSHSVRNREWGWGKHFNVCDVCVPFLRSWLGNVDEQCAQQQASAQRAGEVKGRTTPCVKATRQ